MQQKEAANKTRLEEEARKAREAALEREQYMSLKEARLAAEAEAKAQKQMQLVCVCVCACGGDDF